MSKFIYHTLINIPYLIKIYLTLVHTRIMLSKRNVPCHNEELYHSEINIPYLNRLIYFAHIVNITIFLQINMMCLD